MEINATYPVSYNRPTIEYQKTTVKVVQGEQQTMVYTYDKYGRLVETVVRSHNIAEV
jgi:YD repeat-containing protein